MSAGCFGADDVGHVGARPSDAFRIQGLPVFACRVWACE